MIKLFLTYFLLPTILFAEQQITPYLTSECDTLSLVEGVVNANNGKLVHIDNDIFIEGSDPLEMTRYYDGGHHFSSELGYGMGDCFPTFLQFNPDKDKQNLLVEQRKGLNLVFTVKYLGERRYEGKIDSSYFKSGYTNCCEALLRGEPSLQAMSVEGDINKFIVHLGNGMKRHYQYFERSNNVRYYRLILEERPNGNRRHFSYHHDKELPVKRIWTTNFDDSLTLNWISFTFTDKKIVAEASNGQKVTYLTEQKKGTASGGNLFHNFTAHYKKTFMTGVEADHLPGYRFDPLTHSHYLNTIFSIHRISGPDGRCLEIDYNSKEKVKRLYLHGNDQPLYTFDYHDEFTIVKDGRGSQKRYFYSDKRLEKLEDNHCLHKFKWSKTGELESHIISDPLGKEISKREYQYDKKGNILRVDLTGNITALASKDSYYVRYSHTQDNRNLILTENHNDEREITYGYVPNTNLVASKHTYADQSFVEKEFFQYDKNAILIKKIVDDGGSPDINDLSQTTYRLITEIEPQLNPNLPGLTLPRIVKEWYVDPKTGRQHLLKKIEKIYTAGDLLAEEKVYDANEIYQYSLYYEYDFRRQLIKSINAMDETTLYDYDANHNKIYEEKVESGKRTFYTYNQANRLVEEIEDHADGIRLKSTFAYDTMGNRIKQTDHFGQTTSYQYDLSSRETSVTDPLGYTELKKYDANNHIIEQTDKDGYTTKTVNNIYGSPLKIQYADGTSKQFQYNLEGHLVKEWERDGTFTVYHVDYLGRSLRTEKYSKEGALLKVLRNTYKGKNLISEMDGAGHQTQYMYDGAGRLISKIKDDQITTYEYDSLGRVYKTVKDEEITLQKYDFLDRIIEKTIEDSLGRILSKEEYSYDIHGNRTLQRIYSDNDTFSEYETQYNPHNLPSGTVDPLGNETNIYYSFTDHLEKVTVDPLGRSKCETFDSLNRVQEIKVTSPFGNLIAKTRFSYDGRGNIVLQDEKILSEGVSLGNYRVYTTYDSMGHKVLENEQDQKLTQFFFRYGRLEEIMNPDGVVLTHLYDPLGRLHELKSSDGTVYHRYTYDANDNVIKAEDLINNTTTERRYDTHDRLIFEKQAAGFEIYYSYDALDRLQEVNFDNNRVVYAYSPKDLTSISRYKDGQLQYTYKQQYDWRGRPTLKQFSDSLSIAFAWDKIGRCSEISTQAFSQSLNYDAVGNLVATSVTDPLGSYNSHFSYDALNQLIKESGPFENGYQNDSLNNRRSKNEQPYEINKLNQIEDDAFDTFSYDKNGRRVQKNNAAYTYDALGRLTTYVDSDCRISYQYDPFGRLIRKNDLEYKYQFDTEIGPQTEFRLVYGKGSTFAMEIDGRRYFPIRNHRGDICVVVDEQGNSLSTYRYDAFGAFIHEGLVQSPWLFSSQRYDAITGLYHYDKREYDPALGRWLTPDPLGFADGPNLYAYVQNNPLIFVDPYGLWRETLNYIHAKTNEFSCSFGRGAVDDTTWGASNLAFGPYECNTWAQTTGYYTGTLASMGAGCFYGGTWLKMGGYAGKLALKTCRVSGNYIRGSLTCFKAEKTLNNTRKIAKLAGEGSLAIKKITESSFKSKKTPFTPKEYFGTKTEKELKEILELKFGPPKSTRNYAETYYNQNTKRSFNIHKEPGHNEGKAHVDIRRRGGYPERKYDIKEDL